MATQMQLKVFMEGNHMAARTFTKKKQQQSRVFFMFTLTWITEKELERVTDMEIQSGDEKMRNAGGQQGENDRQ